MKDESPENYEEQFQKSKAEIQKALNATVKRIQKRIQSLQQDLEECLGWEALHHDALLLQSKAYQLRKGLAKIVVEDWEKENQPREISLDPLKDPHIQIKQLFQKSKKLRAGIPYREQLIKKATHEHNTFQQIITQLESATTLEALDPFLKYLPKPPQEPKKRAQEKQLPYREFITKAGLKIWVGKSAANNDILTFSYARGSDWWLHAKDVPGSHVVLCLAGREEPDEESLKDAMQLALAYSKVKSEGDICITQCKYISRFGKGQKGKVHVSKHKTLFARHDAERLKAIKQRAKTE